MAKKTEKSIEEVLVSLETEFDELSGRMERLYAALEKGESFANKVGRDQYDLLIDQSHAMREYRDILAIRIALLQRQRRKATDEHIRKVCEREG